MGECAHQREVDLNAGTQARVPISQLGRVLSQLTESLDVCDYAVPIFGEDALPCITQREPSDRLVVFSNQRHITADDSAVGQAQCR